MTQNTVEFLQPQFINKIVDDRVTTQRQIPRFKWRSDEAVEKSQIRVRAKVVDSSCPTENRQWRTDAARAVPQSEAKSRSQSSKVLSVRLLSGLSTRQPEIKKEVEMEAEAEHRRGCKDNTSNDPFSRWKSVQYFGYR